MTLMEVSQARSNMKKSDSFPHFSGHHSDGGGGSNTPSCPLKSASLPSARLVSQVFHTDSSVPSVAVTHMVTQWGQFLDHDITLTPENEAEHCCDATPDEECYAVGVSPSDTFYGLKNVECLDFSRSVAYCEANGGPRQQINGITSFVDASNVYGSEESTASSLRTFVDGKMLTGDANLLPQINGIETAGDVRALEMPGLATMHTLFLREHNRLADMIKALRPSYSDEKIYQNARRILIGEYQNVVYGQYLSTVLGKSTTNSYGLTPNAEGTSYDPSIDPSMSNEFATAAYRFGHSMIQGDAYVQCFLADA